MWSAFWISAAVVFAAEFGDKSQLLTLTLASRYRALPVLVGVSLSTAALQFLSVVVGGAIGTAFPTSVVNAVAGFVFLGFAWWTWRDANGDEDEEVPVLATRHIVMAVASMFFLAELGDKTMLSSMALAADRNLVGTWAGATVGMITADAIALVIGRALGNRLPTRIIARFSAAAFVVFGMLLLVDAFA